MGNRNTEMFILLLYAALVVFFIYRMVKQAKNKKFLEGEIYEFKKKMSPLEIGLFAVLLLTGLVNLYNGINTKNPTIMATAAVMVLLAIVFGLSTRSKLYIAPNGLLANSSFYNYKELKKWGFDPEKADFIMQVKKDNQASNEVVKVNKTEIEEINKLIRRYKLNK